MYSPLFLCLSIICNFLKLSFACVRLCILIIRDLKLQISNCMVFTCQSFMESNNK